MHLLKQIHVFSRKYCVKCNVLYIGGPNVEVREGPNHLAPVLLWSVIFNAEKTQVLTIANNPLPHPLTHFRNQVLTEFSSHKHLGRIFIDR